MLQQTRVEAVIPYFERFLAAYPTPAAFAAISEAEVLRAWAGLGYYSRARNLQRAAQSIVDDGAFPATYPEIHALPGVGDYTAAAVASIAFNLPHAAVDGNVLRVLARLTNDPSNIKSPTVRNRFQLVADEFLDRHHPGDFNQAMMELGATLCTLRDPACLLCPVAASCQARAAGTERELPVREGNATKVEEAHTLLVIVRREKILLRRRDGNAKRLAGFWELPTAVDLPHAIIGETLGSFRHNIVNHLYRFTVCRAKVSGDPAGFTWIHLPQLEQIPLSTTAKKAVLRLHR